MRGPLAVMLAVLGCGSNSLPSGGTGGQGASGGAGGVGGAAGATADAASPPVERDGSPDVPLADATADSARDVAAPTPDLPSAGLDTGDPTGDAGGNIPVSCLPKGEEKLLVRIKDGAVTQLDVATPAGLRCTSLAHPARGMDKALLDLSWASIDPESLFVVVRTEDVRPGQTGTFTPFSVLMSRENDSWIGAPGKCRVTIASSTRLVEPGAALESYRVSGSVACDGWFSDRPTHLLERFEFTTRLTALAP